MKKVFFTSTIVSTLFFTSLQAQTLDTISLGAGYANQVWYNLLTDAEYRSPKSNWELAFSVLKPDAAIWVHPTINLYRSNKPISAWAGALDTMGLAASRIHQNTDTDWTYGAFNATSSGQFDFGWGSYNLATHDVTGDSIYVLQYPNGTYKKIMIEKLSYDTSYFFKYANLDGTGEQSVELKKATYGAKNFAYYSLTTNSATDREPLRADWDLTALQYKSLAPDANGVLIPYTLTGILHNRGVTTAKIRRDTANNTWNTLTFKTDINAIGANWKSYNQPTNAYTVTDSTAYFVKTKNGRIYKLIFTGFVPADGNMIFKRQYLLGTSVEDVKNGNIALAVYPNPAADGDVQIVYDLGNYVGNAQLQLSDITGKTIWTEKVIGNETLNVVQMPQLNLTSGIYFIQLAYNGKHITQKIVIR
jgi:Secretion system C-terminal sorting domain/HmuY protein